MKKEWKIFLTAVMFLTRIRVPATIDHSPEYLQKSPRYFPLIGWIVGGISVLVFLVFNKFFVEVRSPQTGELIQCVRDTTRTSFSPIRLLNDERRGSGPVFFLNHGQVHMIEEELEDNGTIFQL